METALQTSKTTPKDFFLWLGAIITLYGSVSLLITLLFEYINQVFPDPLAYSGDPYAGTVRFAMAGLIVLVPALIVIMRFIRGSITKEQGKAQIWVRRWAIMLTIFISVATVLIDLITIINTFLGGEQSDRFFLKAGVVLLVAIGVSLHYLADFKGFWLTHAKQANLIGIGVGVLTLAAIISGFFIIGTPGDLRKFRYDDQKVSDLQNIQYQIVNYYQQKEVLPVALADVADPLSGSVLPTDPQTGNAYTYEITGKLSFKLCTVFNAETKNTAGQGAYGTRPTMDIGMGGDENWKHGAGDTCFERTIDPERYPPYKKSI